MSVRTPATATATPAAAVRPGEARRWQPDWAVAVPPAVTLAVMFWGITARPYWGDEADTVSATSRTLPQLIRLLGHIDAVHGLYYLLVWPFIRALGPPELIGRLPSAVAMAGAALGIAVIGRRLVSRRAGLLAGLLFAVLPMTTVQGHDARPYAMSVAAAVLASVLLLRLADNPTGARLTGYGLAIAALAYLDLFGLLLVPAHAITLAVLRRRAGLRRVAVRWLTAMAAVAVASVPLVVFGWLQRHQIAWIRPPHWSNVNHLVDSLAFGSSTSAVLLALLATHGARQSRRSRAGQPPPGPDAATESDGAASGQAGPALAWLAVPWLIVPPVVLISASEIYPAYNSRYVTFCLPAVALLAGAGLAALGRLPQIAALAAVAALAVAPMLSLRGPQAGMRTAAQMIQAREKPGDAFIFPGNGVQPWYLVYPQAFGKLRNIGLATSPAVAGRLYGRGVPTPVLLRREQGVRRIWVIEMDPSWQSPAADLAPGFRRAGFWQPGGGSVRFALYER